jgi:hypothetical protein
MQVIHFTEGAADPLPEICAHGARFVHLADGSGDTHIGCLHLAAGGRIPELSINQACAVLVVHGDLLCISEMGRAKLAGGVGVVLERDEQCVLESRRGAIVILMQVKHLVAHEFGMSTPERIRGQHWPSEVLAKADRLFLADE